MADTTSDEDREVGNLCFISDNVAPLANQLNVAPEGCLVVRSWPNS